MGLGGGVNRQRKRDLPPVAVVALGELKGALSELYGERLRGVYLYGSYARGTFHRESDVDLLVALAEPVKPGAEISRMSPLVSDVCLRHDLLISILPVSVEVLEGGRDAFFDQVRRELVPA
jgi:predicted nucleotidyltransferase